MTLKKGPHLLRFVQKGDPTYFMYFGALQNVLVRDFVLQYNPAFSTRRRPYLLWVSYVSLHGSSFFLFLCLLSRVFVFVGFGSSLFLDTPGVLPGWRLARSSFSMFYNLWVRKDYSCRQPPSKAQYASFELFGITESCLARMEGNWTEHNGKRLGTRQCDTLYESLH